MENSFTDWSWTSALIAQNYTENAKGDMPLIVKYVLYF